jgi:hypothetical protein
MRIYKVYVEHKTYGMNWSSMKVDARTCEEAIKKAKKELSTRERVESVELLASTD